MHSDRKDFAKKISKLADEDALANLGPFAALNRICEGRGEPGEAWKAAKDCRQLASSTYGRLRDQARAEANWALTFQIARRAIPVAGWVLKAYAVAILRQIHIVDVFDMARGQEAFNRFAGLSA